MFTPPAMPPLPPPDGAFRRVRRRAMLRRLRAPSAMVGVVMLAAASLGVIRPHPTSSLEPVTSAPPIATESFSPVPETTPPPSPVATATTATTATTVPTVEPTTPPPSETPAITYFEACEKGGPGRTGPDVTGVVVDRAGHPVPGASVTGRA